MAGSVRMLQKMSIKWLSDLKVAAFGGKYQKPFEQTKRLSVLEDYWLSVSKLKAKCKISFFFPPRKGGVQEQRCTVGAVQTG